MLTSKQMTLPDDLKKKIMAAKKKKPGRVIEEAKLAINGITETKEPSSIL